MKKITCLLVFIFLSFSNIVTFADETVTTDSGSTTVTSDDDRDGHRKEKVKEMREE